MSNNEPTALGVLTPDSARTVLVINDDGEVSVALRERLDRAYALVKDVRPDEALDGFAACIPWPWMVVGCTAELPEPVLEAFRGRPILVFWKGPVPEGLPAHTRTFKSFGDLAGGVAEAMNKNVLGMKLAIGLGVDLPDGAYARSAELQALVANHPHSFDVPLDAFRSAARVLNAHGIPCRPVRDGDSGAVSLVEAAGATS